MFLTVARGPIAASPTQLRAATRLAALATACQAAHFAEELATGFHERFPEQLGLAPWSSVFFVSFNLFWLVVFGLACSGLAARRRVALAPLWFLAIASLVNGLAHPALAAQVGGYFPGLVTSPLVGLLGFLLLQRLARVTRW